MAGTQMTSGANDEMYVGYLPMPRRYARFVRAALPLMAMSLIVGGAIWAWSMPTPGDGVWDTARAREFVGEVVARPYAAIRVRGESGGVETILLVQEGKRGGAEAAAGLEGRVVRARGHVLERDGRRLLELSAGLEALADEAGRPTAMAVRSEGGARLRGEIIDPKCYFGAMKPGEGKTHKACAALCIRGGIPPLLLVREGTGGRTYYVLADAEGGPANEMVLPYVGEPVEVSGQVESRDDVRVLRMAAGGIRRL